MQKLALGAWSEFQGLLAPQHWKALERLLTRPETLSELLTKSECLLYEEDRNLLGMAFLVPGGNPSEIYEDSWCHLRFVSVHPDARGKGIGELLTRTCIELAIRNGEQTMALHTSEIMGPAIRIYEKLGFRVLREIPKSLGVRYWVYTLDLK